MQISSFMLMLWAMAVLGYLYANWIQLPPFLFPMLLMLICVFYLLNPSVICDLTRNLKKNSLFSFKYPDDIFHRNSRFWFLKHCFNCFTAPLHFVTFSDFWLGDQMNSLA